jgi:hypothetical protein
LAAFHDSVEASMLMSFKRGTCSLAQGCLIVVLALLPSAYLAAQSSATAEVHKGWMDDASDAQEDYRFAVAGKDQKAAVVALDTLADLMAKTEAYWTQKKAADGVKLTKDARAFAVQAAASVKIGNMAAAGEAFDRMGATCNSCHDLHLEKR